jgi:hypothetical protein
MFNTMETNPEVYDDVDRAKERVRKGGYAYLMGTYMPFPLKYKPIHNHQITTHYRVLDPGVRDREGLRPNTDRLVARQQGLRHRHPSRLALPDAHLQRHSRTPRQGHTLRFEAEMVGQNGRRVMQCGETPGLQCQRTEYRERRRRFRGVGHRCGHRVCVCGPGVHMEKHETGPT